MLFNEPKLLKYGPALPPARRGYVSVLFNEPKLLKLWVLEELKSKERGFSALQRAEIAEIGARLMRMQT